ncbi:Glutaredoxin-C6 [Capsicum chinense]|nr:Glutaredoxin-C6 [Capsicum chinense]
MQGVGRYPPLSNGVGVTLELSTTTSSPLAIDVTESTEMRIRRLIGENPVVIFTRSPCCCMCHVMKRLLLSSVGVHPAVIQLEDDEIAALSASAAVDDGGETRGGGDKAENGGGTRVGGLESLVALHLSGGLVPKLVEVGVVTYNNYKV